MSTEPTNSLSKEKKTPIQLQTNPILIVSKNYLDIPKIDDSQQHMIASSASRADSKTDLEDSTIKELNLTNDISALGNSRFHESEKELELEKDHSTILSQNVTDFDNSMEDGVSPLKLIARKDSKPLPLTEIKRLGKQIFSFCSPTEETEADDISRKASGQMFLLGMAKTDSNFEDFKRDDDDDRALKRAKTLNK